MDASYLSLLFPWKMGNCLPKIDLPNIKIRVRSTCCSTNVVNEETDVTDGGGGGDDKNGSCCCFVL